MSWIRIILALVVLGVAAGGYYYFDVVKVRENEAAEEAGKKVIAFSPGKAVAFALDRPGKESLSIEKKDGAWHITKPVEALADKSAVDAALSSLRSLDKEGEVEEAAPSLDEFGLKDPVTVTVTLKGGDKRVLKLGDKTPMGGKYYALAPDGRKVIMVGAGAGDVLKNLYDYRDKKLFNFAAGAVAKVVIRRDGNTMTVKKSKTDEKTEWRLIAPIDAAADSKKISGLISNLVSTKVSGFVDDKPDDLAKYGLDKPEASVELADGKGGRLGVLLLGGKTDGGNYLAKLKAAPGVVRVPGVVMDELPKEPVDMRDMALVKINREDVNAIELDSPDSKIRLKAVERGSAEESSVSTEREWTMTAPVEAPADSTAVSGFLYDVENAKVDEFVTEGEYKAEDYGLDKPVLKVTLSSAAGEHEVLFGGMDEAKDSRYAVVDKGAGVVKVDSKTFDSLNLPFMKLRDTRFFPIKSDKVGRVVVERNGQVFDARTFDDKRVLATPEKRDLLEMAWNDLVWTVLDLKYTNEYKKDAVDPLTSGFDRPSLKVSVYNTSGALVDEVLIGAKASDGKSYYAKSANHAEIYRIDEGFVKERIVNALEKLLAE